MKKPPLLQSRASQIANHLRSSIKARQWVGWLPPERELAKELGVARRTIRAALQELEREGRVESCDRQGTRICALRPRKSESGRSVGLLFHNYHPNVAVERSNLVIYLAKLLEEKHIRLSTHRVTYLSGDRVSASFTELMQKTTHDLWVLNTPTAAIERAFAESKRLSLVFGMGNPSVGLPSYSTDYSAISRHAAGQMLQLGHRRIALILPRPLNAEDRQTAYGLESALEKSGHADASYDLFEHDETREGIHRLVKHLLRLKPRPTAWLIGRQEYYIAIHCYLQHLKIDIPGEISLISRDAERYIPHLYPEPSRYHQDVYLIARRYAKVIIRALEGHPPEHHRILPEFIPGETLGTCAKR